MFRQAQKGSLQAFSFSKTKARMAGKGERVTFADVAGLKEAKEELHEIIDFLKNPKKFIDIGAKFRAAFCLWGLRAPAKHCLPARGRWGGGSAILSYFRLRIR